MRLVLIRHATTAETGKRLTGRTPGVSLSPAGVEQAAALAERVGATPPAALYTSPVLRCRETARALGRAWDVAPVPYRSFAEVDYGSWAGRTFGSLRRTKAWRWVHLTPARVRFPGGETLLEVQSRAVAACEELVERHRDARVVVVSHGDVIRAILCHYLGVPLDFLQRLDVGTVGVSVVDLPVEGVPRVRSVNGCGAEVAS